MKGLFIVTLIFCSLFSFAQDDDLMKDIKEELKKEIRAELKKEALENERKAKEAKAKEAKNCKGWHLAAAMGVAQPITSSTVSNYSQTGMSANLNFAYFFVKHFGLGLGIRYGYNEIDTYRSLENYIVSGWATPIDYSAYPKTKYSATANQYYAATLDFNIRIPHKSGSFHIVPAAGAMLYQSSMIFAAYYGNSQTLVIDQTSDGVFLFFAAFDVYERFNISPQSALTLSGGIDMVSNEFSKSKIDSSSPAYRYTTTRSVGQINFNFRLGYSYLFK